MSISENPYRPLPRQCRACSPRPAFTYRVGWDDDSTNHAPPSPSADRHHHRRRQRRRCRSPPPTTSSHHKQRQRAFPCCSWRRMLCTRRGGQHGHIHGYGGRGGGPGKECQYRGDGGGCGQAVRATAATCRCGGVVGDHVDDDDGSRVALGRCAVPAVAKGYGAARCRVVLAATMAARCYAAANPMTSAYHQSVEC
jgi:hypothetical protein